MSQMESVSRQYHRILQLLKEYGIKQGRISRRAGCTQEEVMHALKPECFEQCPAILVLRIRACIELELQAGGWSGNGEDLWQAYNSWLADRRHRKGPVVSRTEPGSE